MMYHAAKLTMITPVPKIWHQSAVNECRQWITPTGEDSKEIHPAGSQYIPVLWKSHQPCSLPSMHSQQKKQISWWSSWQKSWSFWITVPCKSTQSSPTNQVIRLLVHNDVDYLNEKNAQSLARGFHFLLIEGPTYPQWSHPGHCPNYHGGDVRQWRWSTGQPITMQGK